MKNTTTHPFAPAVTTCIWMVCLACGGEVGKTLDSPYEAYGYGAPAASDVGTPPDRLLDPTDPPPEDPGPILDPPVDDASDPNVPDLPGPDTEPTGPDNPSEPADPTQSPPSEDEVEPSEPGDPSDPSAPDEPNPPEPTEPGDDGFPDPNQTIVEFIIQPGTGRSGWNGPDNPLKIRVGQLLRVINQDPTAPHAMHGTRLCGHSSRIDVGGYYDCEVEEPFDTRVENQPYDHFRDKDENLELFWVITEPPP